MNLKDDTEFEEAVRFLSARMPLADELVKPTLLHSLRVGINLYQDGYSKNVAIVGLLHDLVEDANVTEDELQKKFGTEITKLVMVNTKNMNLADERERTIEIVERCATYSEESAVIKAYDILDNLKYYKKTNEPEKLEKLIMMAKLLLEKKSSQYQDKVYNVLQDELNSTG